MTTLIIAKAEPIRDEKIADVTILLRGKPRNFRTLEGQRNWYRQEAHKLAEVLWTTLPGAMVDYLLVELLTRAASLLRVRFPVKEIVRD